MAKRLPSPLEEELLGQIRLLDLPEPVRQFRFAADRRYRSDFAYPDRRILIECEGGIYTRGRHVRSKGYEADMKKYSLGAIRGYLVLRFSGKQIRSGEAVATIERMLRG